MVRTAFWSLQVNECLKTSKKCQQCLELCKQPVHLTIVLCPGFRSSQEGKAKNLGTLSLRDKLQNGLYKKDLQRLG